MNFPAARKVFLSEVIDKRRKLNNDDTHSTTHNLCISEQMKKNIESTFQDQIKQLIRDARVLNTNNDTIDSKSILAHTSIKIHQIPCYTKVYEESMMRPPMTPCETPCKNGNRCECIMIALNDPTINNSKGFVGVSLPEKHNMCILCTRKKVSQSFYHYLITKTIPEICIQPHYNIIERHNEYNKNIVFLPTSFAGITDPFVMHLRHNYTYENNIIIQSSNVNFLRAYMTCNSINAFFLQRTTTIDYRKFLQYTEANYFKKINQAKHFKERFNLEHVLYLNIPYIFDGQSSLEWTEIVSSILDVSAFLPIIFGPKLSTDKTTKNIPIIHIISKGLPQRSQFRNFLTISLDCLEHSDQFKLFFKQLFVWSIIGIHYPWNRVCLPIHKRIQLYELCCIQDTDWQKIVTINVRLFFFMIKEFLCFIIKQNPGLYHVLSASTDWIKYETEIFNVMNDVRHLFSTVEHNPLKQMMTLTQKLLPRPNIVNWPKTACVSTVSSENKLQQYLSSIGFKPMIQEKLETLDEWSQKCHTLKLQLSMDQKLQLLLERVQINESETVEPPEIENICNRTKQLFFNMMFLEKILKNIRQITLPIHQIETQLDCAIKRHDLNTSDESFRQTLFSCTTYYFCIGCEDVKAMYDYGQKKKENTIYSYGHNKLALDPYSGKTFCMGTNTRRKKKELSCSTMPCLKIPMFGKMVSFFQKKFILCALCGTICSVRINADFLKKGLIACGNCSNDTMEQEFCGYCVRKSSSLIKFRIYNDEEPKKNVNPWSNIWLCPRHRNNHWDKNHILLKSILFSNLNSRV